MRNPLRARMPKLHLAAAAACCGALLALIFAGVSGALVADEPEGGPAQVGRVLLITAPRTLWSDLEAGRMPEVRERIADAAVASVSLRTIGSRTDPAEAYATIGAGNRAKAARSDAAVALSPESEFAGGTAADAFRFRTGEQPDAALLVMMWPSVIEDNDRLLYGAEPGALGESLRANGIVAALVGSADSITPRGDLEHHREGALAVADAYGRVGGGEVGGALDLRDPEAAAGVRSNAAARISAVEAAFEEAEVVLAELSDLERLESVVHEIDPRIREMRRAEAFAEADRLAAALIDSMDPDRDLVILLTPTAPRSGEHLGVFAMWGPGIDPGLARSSTTRRAGYVTLPDLAPTILNWYGIEPPSSMNGTPITSTGEGDPTTAIGALVDADEVAVFRERVLGPVTVIYVVLQVLLYFAGIYAVTRGRPWTPRAVAGCALGVLAYPSSVFLMGLIRYDELGFGAVVAPVVISVLVGLLAWQGRRRSLLLAPIIPVGLLYSVLVFDVLSGARLQINTIFGYSPLVAGRFAGYGNLAFAFLSMSAIVTATALFNYKRDVWPARRRWLVAVGVLGIALVVDGLPSLGSDVGGVLALAPAAGVTLFLLAGRTINPARLAYLAGATVAALGLFAALDLLRPSDQRTHLGRFLESVIEGGAAEILQRKLQANVHMFATSVWTYVIPVALVFLWFLAASRRGFVGQLDHRVPGVRACMFGGLVAATLGFAVNDSGVAVPAAMFGVLLPYLSYLLAETASDAKGVEDVEATEARGVRRIGRGDESAEGGMAEEVVTGSDS